MFFPALSIELRRVLSELEAYGAAHDAAEDLHSRKMLNLDSSTAKLVHLLLLSSERKRVLEIGTSNGYSTLWLASAVHAMGGPPLITIERDHDKIEQARLNIRHAGLEEAITLIEGDATTAAATLTGPFDCIFFDADRISAPEQLSILLPKLQADVLLLADNALSHPAELAGYIAAVEMIPGITAFTLPVGKGLHIAHRR